MPKISAEELDQITVRIAPSWLERVEAARKRQRVTRTSFVRTAIESAVLEDERREQTHADA